MKAIFVSVTVALVAIVSWFVSCDEPQPQVVLLSHPAASAVPSALAYPRVEEVTPAETKAVATKVSSAASVAPVLSEQDRYKAYRSPKIVEEFIERRGRLQMEHRKKTGEHVEVLPTVAEKATMIPLLQAKVQEVAGDLQAGHYITIAEMFNDLRNAGVSADELGAKSLETLAYIGQQQADKQAKYITELLNRGCYGTARYIMNVFIYPIAEGLKSPNNMGYQSLDDRITTNSSHEYRGDDPALREAQRLQTLQRIPALGPGCGMG